MREAAPHGQLLRSKMAHHPNLRRLPPCRGFGHATRDAASRRHPHSPPCRRRPRPRQALTGHRSRGLSLSRAMQPGCPRTANAGPRPPFHHHRSPPLRAPLASRGWPASPYAARLHQTRAAPPFHPPPPPLLTARCPSSPLPPHRGRLAETRGSRHQRHFVGRGGMLKGHHRAQARGCDVLRAPGS